MDSVSPLKAKVHPDDILCTCLLGNGSRVVVVLFGVCFHGAEYHATPALSRINHVQPTAQHSAQHRRPARYRRVQQREEYLIE